MVIKTLDYFRIRGNTYLRYFLFFILFSGGCIKNDKESSDNRIKTAYEYYPNGKIKTEAQVRDSIAHGLMKNYTSGGILESVFTYREGRREGPGVIYYPNGQAREKMYYKNGHKTGLSRMYYKTGEVYRETPYQEGKIEGIRRSFYKNGTLMAEAPYKEGYPGIGLKEYNSHGDEIKEIPEIIIKEQNFLTLRNQFILKLSLTEPRPGTIFYIGDLKEGNYLHEELWPLKAEENSARYTLNVSRGGFRMETMTISARFETLKSNYRVIVRKYNLAIDNK